MQDNSRNIYQTARKSAGLTQEAAAERLAVSLTSLRAYEGGERVPAPAFFGPLLGLLGL